MKYALISKPNENYSPMQQILVNRGINTSEIEGYLKTSDSDIYKPTLLEEIESAAHIILHCMNKKLKMFIQVDSDCDGYTSASALINYIYKIDPEYAKECIAFRVHEGKEHGVIVDTVPEDTFLVVIPDAGSNQYEEHLALAKKGKSVLVIDHHDADKVSEDAIVVNNQLSPRYPNKSLSGVGVVYKLCQLLDEILEIEEADKLLDVVALGMKISC